MKKGFTLLELFVVMLIISILIAISVPLYGVINRQASVRSAISSLSITVADARAMALTTRVRHFIRFTNTTPIGPNSHGEMRIYRDSNEDETPQTGEEVGPEISKLALGVNFKKCPAYIIFEYTGFLRYNPGYSDTPGSQLYQNNPNVGDVICYILPEEFTVMIDLVPASGKVGKYFFYASQ
jgi:prepilin-type N-terminal cleavage/methylation domain-containing protein